MAHAVLVRGTTGDDIEEVTKLIGLCACRVQQERYANDNWM